MRARLVLFALLAIAGCKRRSLQAIGGDASPAAAPSSASAPTSTFPTWEPRTAEKKIIAHAARIKSINDAVEDTNVPDGPHHSGEQVRDCWVAPDGTELISGYMYTGVPGPDTGVVYRRKPGEAQFSIAHTTPRHELGAMFGTTADDLWVGGTGVLVHCDGKEWKEQTLPPGVGHVSALTVHEGTLWLASSSPQTVFRRKLEATTWERDEQSPDWRWNRIVFAGEHLFAGGTTKIGHRFPDGHWAIEVNNRGAGYDTFYVASPKDVYVAGGLTFGAKVATLLHGDLAGNWTPIDSADHVPAYGIFGRKNEIFVATETGVRQWTKAKGFVPTKLRSSRYISGNANEIFVAYEEHPKDLPHR